MEFAVIILGAALVVAAAILAFALTRTKPASVEPARPDSRLDTLLAKQGEIGGQFAASVQAQEALTRLLGERLEALEKRVGDNLQATAKQTGETFVSITERLSVIDVAQKNISALSSHVVSLQQIFSDKQQRGAFAQDIMESIVSDHMAPDQYEFQAKLTNGKIVDCAIRIPNVAGRIVVDSKFPHEGFEAMRGAENEDARKAAMVQIRGDIQKHVKDISEKYLISGETQSPAIMFVPSDGIYAELHANFPETMKRARQSQVVLASPHVFMLVVTTLLGLMRDAKMREQAQEIQREVGLLLKDVRLLAERVGDLRTHFERTSKDIGEIEKPMARIASRAEKIERAELAPPDGQKNLS
ncbi:MAG TPA: DNA recombination protein RmuC [Rhizomicrobium sp.]|jgi:DNA recombination protein RmuC|nr:DNA recombination protein RmuC [Rhizomicrobium sp.]